MLDMMQSNLFEDEILSGGEPTPEVDQAAQLRQQLEDEQRALRAEAEAARTDAWQARQERDRADDLRMQAEWKAQQDRKALEDAALAMQDMNDGSGDAGDWVRALAAVFLRQVAVELYL